WEIAVAALVPGEEGTPERMHVGRREVQSFGPGRRHDMGSVAREEQARDAAHILPPTGAKGLNLAASDVHYLCRALIAWYKSSNGDLLARYSEKALARVWKAERFSWWMTNLMHRLHEETSFEAQMQRA